MRFGPFLAFLAASCAGASFCGWVDRPCDKSVFSPTDRPSHDYRTICEIEP